MVVQNTLCLKIVTMKTGNKEDKYDSQMAGIINKNSWPDAAGMRMLGKLMVGRRK